MSEIDTHEATHNNLVIHVLAPLAAMGATWATRKALDTGYRSVTGRIAPNSQDVQVRLGSAVMWAAITAASAAIVEVAVFRFLAKKA
ncbi:MAG: DUF4235 domain-containing protein [Candidatus Nanopelagicales bacterium]|jgi:hypothetical protein